MLVHQRVFWNEPTPHPGSKAGWEASNKTKAGNIETSAASEASKAIGVSLIETHGLPFPQIVPSGYVNIAMENHHF